MAVHFHFGAQTRVPRAVPRGMSRLGSSVLLLLGGVCFRRFGVSDCSNVVAWFMGPVCHTGCEEVTRAWNLLKASLPAFYLGTRDIPTHAHLRLISAKGVRR